MFELNRDSIEINSGKITKIIINLDDNSANIDYQVGYMKDDEFHGIGTETLFIKDIPEEEIFDYTKFYAQLNSDGDVSDICLNLLIEKGIVKA